LVEISLFLPERDYVTFGYLSSQIRLFVCQPVEIFGNVLPHLYLSYPLIFVQNFTEIVSGEPICRGFNAKGVAKYSDVGPVKGYISEMVQDTASGTINDTVYISEVNGAREAKSYA